MSSIKSKWMRSEWFFCHPLIKVTRTFQGAYQCVRKMSHATNACRICEKSCTTPCIMQGEWNKDTLSALSLLRGQIDQELINNIALKIWYLHWKNSSKGVKRFSIAIDLVSTNPSVSSISMTCDTLILEIKKALVSVSPKMGWNGSYEHVDSNQS